jgi:hypothetical protein
MQKQIGTLVLAGLVTLAAPAFGQGGGVIATSSPGQVSAAQTVEVTATITAIDPKTRDVKLKGPEGKEVTFTAGPEVKNFAQMKVGDQVKAKYVEALMLDLHKGSTAPVSRVDDSGAAVAKPGERPGVAAGQQITVVAEITALDAARQMVTLRGPMQSVDLKVNDPAQFKLMAKGDRVVATYTQAVAIMVEPVAKPTAK